MIYKRIIILYRKIIKTLDKYAITKYDEKSVNVDNNFTYVGNATIQQIISELR